MVNYTGPARKADKQLDQFARYKGERTEHELNEVRNVFTVNHGNTFGLPLKKK
jgi:hypothetical protein